MANVQKFRLKDSPRLLSHCARTMKVPGSHIHQERTVMNFNLAAGLHDDMSDYEFTKARINQPNVKRLNRDDVKDVCSWAITMPRELCHESVTTDGEELWEPNDDRECKEFFRYAYEFLKIKHGEQNIISANVHMDENVPHMHFVFTPIVPDKKHPGQYKMCAKEALHDCYGAKFQIELQDYISAKMGKEIHMVKKDTVDYERNVKELKKKTLNERVARLNQEIREKEELIKRMDAASKAMEAGINNSINTNIKHTSSRGYTVLKDEDFNYMQRQLSFLNAMKAERDATRKLLKEFKNENQEEKIGSLEEEIKRLKKENKKMQAQIQEIDKLIEFAKDIYGENVIEKFEKSEKEKKKKEKSDMNKKKEGL